MLRAIAERLVATIRVGLGVLLATLLVSASASAGPPEKADVLTLACFFANICDPVNPDLGDAMLVRTPNGLNMKIWAMGLDPSAVYTVWWVIAGGGNNPPLCVMWATGHPIGPDGTGYFAAHLNEGEPWTEAEPSDDNGGAGECDGLVDSDTANVGLVTRTHGPIQPGSVYEQMGTYLGGCATEEEPGLFPCNDQHIAFFPAP